jgi:superfamily I DNA/RNA helicase
MPITPSQINKASIAQNNAAHDTAPQVRLIAGPGTGKSFAIEERVKYLLSNNVPPFSIFVVSFTRESTRDLRERVVKKCLAAGLTTVSQVNVSTLHSLALRILRNAGILKRYIVSPSVLDDWELDNIYDSEFSQFSGYTPSRCSEIRREHEAYWSTGNWSPPNYLPPNPPISTVERQQFVQFYSPRASTYCCVLPGEIVRSCVDAITAGTLNPQSQLNIEHLIVDEYQDLNRCDQQFIDFLINHGVIVFIAGDDDQSIYSFRFASPSGIQTFTTQYPNTSPHILADCFRCTTSVLKSANKLITMNQAPGRIPKNLISVYSSSVPPVSGNLFLHYYRNDSEEARAIAVSCNSLILAGIPANDILVLLSNSRALSGKITQAFVAASVPFRPPKAEAFTDTDVGRFVLSQLRIVCNPNDYIAYRTLLGLQQHIGPRTCNSIATSVVQNSLNYCQLFTRPLPQGAFTNRELGAIQRVRNIIINLNGWSANDTLSQRITSLSANILSNYCQGELQKFVLQTAHLPQAITLEELRDYLWASNDAQEARLLESVYTRLGLPIPTEGFKLPLVRIMTMHGSKGLSAGIVFIPGLEEDILPGKKRRPYPGLVLEAARMLYVAMTRARACCVISYCKSRFMNGKHVIPTPSQFSSQFGGVFNLAFNSGLSNVQVKQIVNDYSNL